MSDQTRLLAVGIEAARAGGEQLLAWRGRFQAREKGPSDLVTDADLAAERVIKQVIQGQFPDHAVLGEESAGTDVQTEKLLDQEFCWVVDPLDGTCNYVHGFPCYGVSIGLTYRGTLEVGVVFDPVADELFAAVAGGGATLNGQSICASGAEAVEQSLVAVSFPPNLTTNSPDVEAFLRVAPICQAVRRTGSAALNLAYVACGRLDAHWAHHIKPWDAAAGVLLVREAAGVATASDGGPFDVRQANYLVAATAQLHANLLPLVAGKTA